MRRLLKFPLGTGITLVWTLDEPRFLAVGWQGDQLVVWVEATAVASGPVKGGAAGARDTRLAAFTTGEPVPPNAEYIGTAQHPTLNGGTPLVVHVYRGLL